MSYWFPFSMAFLLSVRNWNASWMTLWKLFTITINTFVLRKNNFEDKFNPTVHIAMAKNSALYWGWYFAAKIVSYFALTLLPSSWSHLGIPCCFPLSSGHSFHSESDKPKGNKKIRVKLYLISSFSLETLFFLFWEFLFSLLSSSPSS